MSDCCETSGDRADACDAGDGVEAYDLVVVGSGGAGVAAALEARDRDARVLMIEAGVLGGTCVNVGCVPSKILVRAGMAAHAVRHPGVPGVGGAEPEVDADAIVAARTELVASLREAKYAGVLERAGVDVLRGRARFLAPYVLDVDGRILRAAHIVLATGTRAALPDVPGLRAARPWSNVELLTAEHLPASLVVLGGGYVAVEAAQAFARLGTRVTLLQRSARILRHEEPDVSRIVEAALRADGVDLVTSTRLLDVAREADGVRVGYEDADGMTRAVEAAELLSALGRVANVEALDLPAAGIAVDEHGFLAVDETLACSVPGHFGAGDVIGPPSFVYTAAAEGRLAAANAVGESATARPRGPVPHVVFSDPQVARVGATQAELEEAGTAFERARIELKDIPRFLVDGAPDGFIELLRDGDSDLLLGATIVAPEAGDLIMLPTLAMQHGITVAGLVATLHPYLTGAEGIRLAARTFDTNPKMLSCCA